MLTKEKMLSLGRWNTPAVYNGWEAITNHDRRTHFNLEPIYHREPPVFGTMVGTAVTVTIEPGNPDHCTNNPNAWHEYREYLSSIPGPKIVVVKDLDAPKAIGAYWGEINTSIHLALGCVGSITDGYIRDCDEIRSTGFKIVSRGTCVGHAWSYPVTWGEEIEVFGTTIAPGDLIHADQHGFLTIPEEDHEQLFDAVSFLDDLEIKTLLSTARTEGLPPDKMVHALSEADRSYKQAYEKRFKHLQDSI